MILVFPQEVQDRNPPDSTVAPPKAQQVSDNAASWGNPEHMRMSDSARECAIGLAASRIEHWMNEWQSHGNFDDKARADVARMQMEALINGRSPEAVARMEAERGLS